MCLHLHCPPPHFRAEHQIGSKNAPSDMSQYNVLTTSTEFNFAVKVSGSRSKCLPCQRPIKNDKGISCPALTDETEPAGQ